MQIRAQPVRHEEGGAGEVVQRQQGSQGEMGRPPQALQQERESGGGAHGPPKGHDAYDPKQRPLECQDQESLALGARANPAGGSGKTPAEDDQADSRGEDTKGKVCTAVGRARPAK